MWTPAAIGALCGVLTTLVVSVTALVKALQAHKMINTAVRNGELPANPPAGPLP